MVNLSKKSIKIKNQNNLNYNVFYTGLTLLPLKQH
jgi:hypothetical protein